MTDYKEENDELRREIKRLTQENKALRMTALDEFAKAVLCGVVSNRIIKVDDAPIVTNLSYKLAELMIDEKVRRYES